MSLEIWGVRQKIKKYIGTYIYFDIYKLCNFIEIS